MYASNLVSRDANKSLTTYVTAARPGRYDFGSVLSLSGTFCPISNIDCAKCRLQACPTQKDRARMLYEAATEAARAISDFAPEGSEH